MSLLTKISLASMKVKVVFAAIVLMGLTTSFVVIYLQKNKDTIESSELSINIDSYTQNNDLEINIEAEPDKTQSSENSINESDQQSAETLNPIVAQPTPEPQPTPQPQPEPVPVPVPTPPADPMPYSGLNFYSSANLSASFYYYSEMGGIYTEYFDGIGTEQNTFGNGFMVSFNPMPSGGGNVNLLEEYYLATSNGRSVRIRVLQYIGEDRYRIEGYEAKLSILGNFYYSTNISLNKEYVRQIVNSMSLNI